MESLSSLLSSFTTALDSAASVVPAEESILPPANGISLLNVKNELLLSYIQHLTFLLLLKLRQSPRVKDIVKPEADDVEQEAVVKKLVELRVYLEKGVRPLEGRLKYQIDKVVNAVEDADRAAQQQQQQTSKLTNGTKKTKSKRQSGDEPGASSDDSDADSQADSDASSEPEIDELSYRPNPAAFRRAAVPESAKDEPRAKGDGIYRPPRIAPTAMAEPTRGKEQRESRRPMKSATMDEFIANEYSTAPMAEPSIGSTIVSGGRHTKSRKEREEEAEKRDYEETNLVRLPKQSKKERAKMGGNKRDNFGGEDWRDLSAGLGRIDKLTSRKSGSSGGALANSRKRPIEDGPRDSGMSDFGRAFEKKRRTHSRNRRG